MQLITLKSNHETMPAVRSSSPKSNHDECAHMSYLRKSDDLTAVPSPSQSQTHKIIFNLYIVYCFFYLLCCL